MGHRFQPRALGPLVIQLCDSETTSSLVALDKLTGQEVWRTPRASNGSWTTPVLLEAKTGTTTRWELIVNGSGTSDGSKGWVSAYDPATGSPLWRVQGTTDIPVPTAITADDLVISTSGASGPILAIRPGGEGDVTATRVVWEVPGGAAVCAHGPCLPGPAVHGFRWRRGGLLQPGIWQPAVDAAAGQPHLGQPRRRSRPRLCDGRNGRGLRARRGRHVQAAGHERNAGAVPGHARLGPGRYLHSHAVAPVLHLADAPPSAASPSDAPSPADAIKSPSDVRPDESASASAP